MRPSIGYSTLYWINKDKKRLSDAEKVRESENSTDSESEDDSVSEESLSKEETVYSNNIISFHEVAQENDESSVLELKSEKDVPALIFDDKTSLWSR